MFKKLNKKVVSNIISLLILQGANYILPLITLPYLVRVLGAEKFGILAFALAVVRYFQIFIEYGFNLSATREISIHIKNKKYISQVFSTVIIIKTCFLIFSFLILFVAINIFDRLYVNKLVYYFTFLMLIGNVLFPVWYFQGIEKMKYITYINISAKVFFTVLIFVFIKNSSDYIYVPLINSLGIILAGLIAFFIALKEAKFVLPKVKMFIDLFKESTHLFIANVSITLFTASNVFILGLFANDSIVGIYSSIERLIQAIKNLFVPIYQGIFPWLSRKDKEEIKIFIKKIMPFVFLFSFILTIFIFMFSKQILQVIYNNDIITQHYYILQIFSLIPVLSALNMLFNFLYLNAVKAYKIRTKIMIYSGIVNIVCGVILTYFFSIVGITLGVVFTEFVLLLLGYFTFKRGKIEK